MDIPPGATANDYLFVPGEPVPWSVRGRAKRHNELPEAAVFASG
jgi:hypothetical protein